MDSNPLEKQTRKDIARWLGWNRTSYTLLSALLAIILLIIIVWWPLVIDYFSQINPAYPIWLQLDWLLIGLFAFMSLSIMAGADLKADAWIVWIGLCGGLVIEGWGTQTRLWTYFTQERPPLWIIPAWPIASLTIDRMVRFIDHWLPDIPLRIVRRLFWMVFLGFYLLMTWYVWPTLDKPLTILALIACALLMLAPGNYRTALLTFLAGSALGYFLEIWGTTRECWTYYTRETPPVFAVFAHGLAAFAFWRVAGLFRKIIVERFLQQSILQKIKSV
jgi:hypothetical protein